MAITLGQTHGFSIRVEEPMTAEHFGNAGIPVLATPCLVGLVERACIEAVAPHLDEGQGTVGTLVEIRHLAATPVGLTVTLSVEVTSVEGRLIGFKVTGHDGIDTICEATHGRAVVNVEKFVARSKQKLPA
ncbi:thioesterase family protein [Pseudogemmobacter sonorensis]|uniref:thioesterase family protein n=1 Tax=Pseudogemmobacter sonorensis TaxID=2989681 RepID=UPI0036A2D23B